MIIGYVSKKTTRTNKINCRWYISEWCTKDGDGGLGLTEAKTKERTNFTSLPEYFQRWESCNNPAVIAVKAVPIVV